MRTRAILLPLALLALAAGGTGCAALGLGGHTPAWELPPPEPVEAPVTREGAVHRTTLPNGLKVIVLEDHRLPRVSFSVTARRGAAMVPTERAGLASFTAELLERGAGERDVLEFAEAVDALGARFSASAGWDSTSAGIAGLSRDADALLGLLADAVLRPRFDPAEAGRARAERLAALERAVDDPGTLAGWYLARAIYPDHRYGVPLEGTPETVAELDVAAARAFHARVWVPNGCVVSVVGDVDPEAVVAALRAHFAAWERGEVPEPGPAPPPLVPGAPADLAPAEGTIVVVDRPDLAQARIALGHEGIARTADDRLAVSIMNLVVGGGGFSSRLMTSLRSEEGLTYGVYSGYSLRRQPGPFSVSTFTRVDATRRALDIVLEELRRGRSDPPGPDELSWARTLATGQFSMALETSDAVADALVNLEIYGLPDDSLDTYRSRIRAVTAEEVARAAREHLFPGRAAIVLVGPADALVPQVEDLGPVEVVTP